MEQPEAAKIGIGPSNIRNHGLEGSEWKCVTNAVVRDNRPASVGMPIDAVAASGPYQPETISMQRPN
jgi:hypothetical protein